MKRGCDEVHVRSYIGEEEEDVSGEAEVTCEVSGRREFGLESGSMGARTDGNKGYLEFM